MTLQVIPTSITESHYEIVTQLDGRAYVLRFDWHDRWERWTVGVYTVDRDPIATGVALAVNFPLCWRVRDARLWPGTLWVVSQDGLAPGLVDLRSGDRCFLAYTPAADLA